ncbi:DUF2334 domain-containing protein [Hoyosella rhizosphaerae]|uniref:DUF2334 domain-containing protein n=1 Tax=Hoyosella rhizosphaerae TaxID=1755582 RepID=A0A916XI50_9ACTN|nr:DUF2334 domain-containing protein [Hoyosella rhizosphaerae]MBN4928273.1 DUF2334 domain-containing protein [Hoyosella rhizosphaerae]GGC73728.1 hypothetical protein GCM10011410_28600 [Hoyosella rhizosphaerae]
MSSELLVSVSGIRDTTVDLADSFLGELAERDVPVSLLVAPRMKGKYRLLQDPHTQEWFRDKQSGGAAIVMHGYDQAATKKRRAEFATLRAHEAMLRLVAADRVMEESGLRTRLFAPPQWTLSEGALMALPRVGFRVCADLTSIRDLDRNVATRTRVLGVGEGFLSEPWWCKSLIMSAERIARRGGVVRLAIKAKHLERSGPRQAFLDAIDVCLYHGARSATYRWPYHHDVADAA